MINNLKDKTITKRQAYEWLKTWLKKEKEQKLRNMISEDSFEKVSWDKYLAHQLGFYAALEELDKLIPDPTDLND